MNLARKILQCFPAVLFIAGSAAAVAASNDEARVTRVIRDVKLLPPEADAKPASVNDTVAEDTAVRTGVESRSELTFVDLTITRLGADTTFTFNKGGHNVQLNDGTVLLYVPKDSGGAQMATKAVSVAITGTTVVLRYSPSGHSQLTVLEDGARATLIKHPRETTFVRAGQMIDVEPGATKMPRPVNIDLRQVMKSPLITDFPPLPSQDLILAGIKNPPADQSQSSGPPATGSGPPVVGQPAGGSVPVGGGPVFVPPAAPTQHHHRPPVIVDSGTPDNSDEHGNSNEHGKPSKHKKPRYPKRDQTPGDEHYPKGDQSPGKEHYPRKGQRMPGEERGTKTKTGKVGRHTGTTNGSEYPGRFPKKPAKAGNNGSEYPRRFPRNAPKGGKARATPTPHPRSY